MSHTIVIFLSLLVVCFVIRMPIAIGMIISSTLCLAVRGMDSSVVVEIFTNKMCNNFILLTVPLSISATNIMNFNRITDKIFGFSEVLMGRWEDGLGHVNITASLTFSGMASSMVAGASGLGITKIEAIREGGYNGGFSTAIIAGSAIIGPILPLSIPLVIYRVIAGASINNLSLVGMMPEIILALALCIYVCYTANKRSYPSGRKYVRMEFIKVMMDVAPALLTPIILLTGIYTGIMTATEAGTAAALYVLLISVFAYRSITLSEFIQVLKSTMKSTGQIGITLGIAYVFPYAITVENLPSLAGNPILSLATTKVSFPVFVDILLFILEMLLDPVVLQLVSLPILCPIAQPSGIDMVHFGVVFTLNTMIGLCIPSFGMLLFIVIGVSGEKMNTIIKEVMPMVFVTVLVLVLITFVPDVIMWLPRLSGR